MKNFLLLTVAFTVLYVTQTPSAEGQILFNYALGGGSFTPSNAVVRTVNDQNVIASYWDGTYYRLARVGLIDIISAKMDDRHQIADIRIVRDDIFFCGMNRSTNHAFLGHATVPDIESQNPHIEFYDIIIPNTTSTRFWRLAAYEDLSGRYHLVVVGEMWYYNGVTPSNACPCPLLTHCQSTIVAEYTYQFGTFSYADGRVLNDQNGHYEYACDVVETDNYVAVVTFPAADELIIHRCDKNNLWAPLSFDTYYRYKVPPSKVLFNGCRMKEDTIAVASVFNNGPGTDNMQVRVVDLATMNMSCAQTFDLKDKDDIYEMAYLPDVQRLVLLTYHTYTPLTLLIHTFCFLKPYETVFPYTMEKIYDINRRSFTSLDRLSSQHIVAAGGDYWIMKEVPNNNPASTCYVTKTQPVKELSTSIPIDERYGFLPFSAPGISSSCNEVYDSIGMNTGCLTP